MNIPGERFDLEDLEEIIHGEDDPSFNPTRSASPTAGMSFIADIVDKPTSSAPKAPVLAPNAPGTGFPAHKPRIPKNPSRFKQRAQAAAAAAAKPVFTQPDPRTAEQQERQQISNENDRRIAAMSPEEIAEERRELMGKLDPKLLQTILKRANLETPGSNLDAPPTTTTTAPVPQASGSKPPRPTVEDETPESKAYYATIPKKTEPSPAEKAAERAFNAIPNVRKAPKKATLTEPYDPDNAAPPVYDESLFPPAAAYHFPTGPQPSGPELDPSSPDFFKNLHDKFYPDLPADPSKLAWMKPVTATEDHASYHPEHTEVSAAALRFDFKGNLLAPRTARELPVFLGLHHHADAPNAAGYTVPELARLARSTFPTQRCIAMQLLGRILYKLGKGVYGVPEIQEGLWQCIEGGKVLETLEETAKAPGGHMSVKAYATDAMWFVNLPPPSNITNLFPRRLWQQGGGKQPKTMEAT